MMKKNNGIEFLLYSYFKIELNATKDEIIESSVENAYRDATNQGAYNTKIKTVSDKDRSVYAKNNAEKIIKDFIEKSLSDSDYDELHKTTCRELLGIYADLPFSYGNAQKWINMTMKNLYVISLLIYNCCESANNETTQFCENIIKISPRFHVPIDSYIIEKIWDTKISLPDVKFLKDGTKGMYTSDKVKGWSNWNEEEYVECQKSLKEYIKKEYKDITPIEWEGPAWIEIAKKRSAK